MGFQFLKSFSRRRAVISITIGILLVGAAFVLWKQSKNDALVDEALLSALPLEGTREGFIGSESCRECHVDQHSSWQHSYHSTMTQVASPQSVLAPFDGQELHSRGRDYRFDRRGEEFWVNMADPEWENEKQNQGWDLSSLSDPPMVNRRILLTTGSHHYQTYWVAGRFGRELLQVPWIYHLTENRWIPREDAFLLPPDTGRHFARWNDNCIICHAVAGKPGLNPDDITGDPQYDPQMGALTSEVAEFGIACEACHGPGEEHVKLFRGRGSVTNRQSQFDPAILNPAKCSPRTSSQICGRCHSDFDAKDVKGWLVDGFPYKAGDDIDEVLELRYVDFVRQLENPGPGVRDLYWGDGAIRVGGREYLGLVESPCYQKGELSCLSCHSMHSSDPDDQLATGMRGDDACLQCHSSMSDRIAEHSHHAADSPGSRCYNCHMPHTSYVLFKAIRSHRVDSPSVASSVETGRPNACNLCHLDQSLEWAGKHLSDWYGVPRVEMTEQEAELPASVLWMLKGDAVQRVVTAWHVGWEPAAQASTTDWLAPVTAQLLNDPYPAVRFVAGQSLKKLPAFGDFDYDFIAPRVSREEAITAATNAWSRLRYSGIGISPTTGRILLPNGNLNQTLIEELIRQRDDRPVFFPE